MIKKITESLLQNAEIEFHNPSNGYRYNITVAKFNNEYELTVYTSQDNKEWGSEYYTGENYLVGNVSRSYSRNFKAFFGLPTKFVPVINELIEIHNNKYKTNLDKI